MRPHSDLTRYILTVVRTSSDLGRYILTVVRTPIWGVTFWPSSALRSGALHFGRHPHSDLGRYTLAVVRTPIWGVTLWLSSAHNIRTKLRGAPSLEVRPSASLSLGRNYTLDLH